MRDNALHIIRTTRKKWISIRLLSVALNSAALSLLLSFLAHTVLGQPLWASFFIFIAVLLLMLSLDRSWQIPEKEVARFLNKQYPSLEESCELLFKDPSSLNLLQKLQADRTANALQQIGKPALPGKSVFSLLMFVGAVLVYLLLIFMFRGFSVEKLSGAAERVSQEKINLPAGVADIIVKIVSPSYTRKPMRIQKSFNLEIEEGSAVHWNLTLKSSAATVTFVYNDSLQVLLRPLDKEHLVWSTDRVIVHSGFYQVKIDSIVSELYKLEVVQDHPPVISVVTPKPTTVIEYGDPQKINLQTIVSDDYGIKDAAIYATVAKGSGEGVKFKTQKISFGTSFAAEQKQYELKKTIGLAALGMQPADELYFYIAATDNHGQEKRSDIYIVSITDTASLMNMDGLLNGVNLKPDYFRSQRQIILDAEQLLREKDTALAQNFNNRSNNLGIDQKLLRLRYGKFLGEEASSNEDVAGDNGLGNPADFGNANVILDAFTDHHDNAEDATFLDPETKKQLKAVLNEMWSSELQLRMFKPKEALPFAYKALRLLKDLQQKSRVYVAKTSIKTAPIKLEKRLTGKLEKIIEPVTNTTIAPTVNSVDELRKALAVMEQLKNDVYIDERAIRFLRLASVQLSNAAAKEPALYLSAYESMKKIIDASQRRQSASRGDIVLSEKALQKMAGIPFLLPSKKQSVPGLTLSEQYFQNLHKNTQR
jgi:hypothetical protein